MDSAAFVQVTNLIDDQKFLKSKIKFQKLAIKECDTIRYALQIEQDLNADLTEDVNGLKKQRWWFGLVGFLLGIVLSLI